jgi:CheY-like chemotaxis protein
MHVLLVEDDANDVMLMRTALTRTGLNTQLEVVHDGEQALHYLQRSGEYANRRGHPYPSVIVIDLKMPRVNGLEVLRWLHDHPECPAIPTIVFSASRMDQDVQEAYRLGASSYFVKPTGFQELLELVKIMYSYWERAERPPVPDDC